MTLLVGATLLVNYSHKFKLWVGFISLGTMSFELLHN